MLLCLSICFVMLGAAQAARAATFTVDTITDDTALTACTAAANDCSLRGAIITANAAAGADTIEFDAAVFSTAQTIAFTWSSPKQHLVINSDLTINGPGANLLTIKGYPIGNGTYVSTLFEITGGVVAINNLKLTGGFGKTCSEPNGVFSCGGAISMSGGTATVSGTTISDNIAARGGGIYTSGGTLNVTDSTISANNSASTGSGGGIYVNGGSANVINTTISGNLAGYGGGVNNSGGTLNINNSTISGNTASGNAGGIRAGTAALTITNSTITGNRATGATSNAGGIRCAGIVKIANSTISGNTAANGGGIYYLPANSNYTLTLTNSIVAGNTATSSPDIYGTIAGDYNLVKDTAGATLAGTHNIIGQPAQLAALADNGGATKTMALDSGSPAINTGDPAFDTNTTPFDQRGGGFARKVGGTIDIGAFDSADGHSPARFDDREIAHRQFHAGRHWKNLHDLYRH